MVFTKLALLTRLNLFYVLLIDLPKLGVIPMQVHDNSMFIWKLKVSNF